MKHIIIEAPDRLGKNTLIKGLCETLEYDNVCIRHFGKPPRETNDPLFFQKQAFIREAELLKAFSPLDGLSKYFDNTIIWNRSHLGEYVYGTMFRNLNKQEIWSWLDTYENTYLDIDNTYLILLYGSPDFLLKNEDGKSFSQTLSHKKLEMELFTEVLEKSNIKNKLIIPVEDIYGTFFDPSVILEIATNFINKKNVL